MPNWLLHNRTMYNLTVVHKTAGTICGLNFIPTDVATHIGEFEIVFDKYWWKKDYVLAS